MPGQEKRKKRLLNRRERAQRLQVSRAATVAFRLQSADSEDALVGNEHMAQLSPKALSPLDDVAFNDDATAQTGADDRRNGRRPIACAEDREVAPEGSRVPIIKIRHRFAEPICKILADIKSRP